MNINFLKFTAIFITCSLVIYFNVQDSPKDVEINDISTDQSYYTQKVQPIFDAKCIACHSCYNSPCQLNFTSYHSTLRGANKTSIYDFPLLKANKPTRMFQDAKTIKEWRDKEFFSVLGTKDSPSILNYMIGLPHGIESNKQEFYESEKSRVCISNLNKIETLKYKKNNPAGRMPYGFPALENEEIEIIKTWQDLGSKGPNLISQEQKILNDPSIKEQVSKWELFLNQKNLKSQLSSRYIYEHLFLAHIYFDSHPAISFRIVRSKSLHGEIEEISTRFPFDNPGPSFSYRLRPVVETIVHKSHIPFEFNDQKLEKWDKEFLQSKWTKTIEKLPTYGREASNPYKVFEAIPVKTRYKFLIDESNYHIMTFIKGPVCRGQTALNVINDHFWVFFLDPDKDPLANSDELYDYVASNMVMPAKLKDDFNPLVDLREYYWKTVKKKYKGLAGQTLSEDWLWDGDKNNLNASATVMRHFDSAHVLKGLQGRTPKTVWVLDYHIFESIYYNLTAGYDVFGPLLHQVNSRLFMEISRIASEDLFLTFLPKKVRQELRKKWNTPTPTNKESTSKWIVDLLTHDAEEEMEFKYVYHGGKVNSKESAIKDTSKVDFLKSIKEEVLSENQIRAMVDEVPSTLRKFNKLESNVVASFPDTILVKYKDEIYTLVHHKDHYNVSMLFYENDRRNQANDSIDVIPGVVGSYPNLFMILNEENLKSLISSLKSAKSKEDALLTLEKYSIKRSDQRFWKSYEYFSKESVNKATNEFGFLDLNRYSNLRSNEI